MLSSSGSVKRWNAMGPDAPLKVACAEGARAATAAIAVTPMTAARRREVWMAMVRFIWSSSVRVAPDEATGAALTRPRGIPCTHLRANPDVRREISEQTRCADAPERLRCPLGWIGVPRLASAPLD